MAAKRLLFRSAAREKVLSGAAALADAVRITPGPKSKCVLIQKKWGKPIVCNGGITIANEVELEDPEANLGAQLIREAAERTGEAVGDGISTSAILAHAIFAEGLHNVAAGTSAVDLKRSLDRGLIVALRSRNYRSHESGACRTRDCCLCRERFAAGTSDADRTARGQEEGRHGARRVGVREVVSMCFSCRLEPRGS